MSMRIKITEQQYRDIMKHVNSDSNNNKIEETVKQVVNETLEEGWLDFVKGAGQKVGGDIANYGKGIYKAGVNANNMAKADKAYQLYQQLSQQLQQAKADYAAWVKKGYRSKYDVRTKRQTKPKTYQQPPVPNQGNQNSNNGIPGAPPYEPLYDE